MQMRVSSSNPAGIGAGFDPLTHEDVKTPKPRFSGARSVEKLDPVMVFRW